MKKLFIIALLCAAGWQAYSKVQGTAAQEAEEPSPLPSVSPVRDHPPTQSFKCDGRTHCSQMRSCEEATFFLQNCPGVKMDGNNDGIPCEKQWCR